MTHKNAAEGFEEEYARWKWITGPLQKAQAISAWVEENDAGAETRHDIVGMTPAEFAWLTLSTATGPDEEDVDSMRRAVKAHADERTFYELRRDYDNFSDLDLLHYFWVTKFLITGEIE